MDMIYKRGEVFWVKYYSGGKPIRESTGTSKQKQAERLLKDREGRVAIGAPALPRLERIRFAEIAEALIEHYHVTGIGNSGMCWSNSSQFEPASIIRG